MIRNPKYTSLDGSIIDVELNHPEFGWIPFTASPDDVEQHGRDIYAAAIAGEYGPIAPYDGPSEEELLEQQVREQRDQLLADVDAVVTNPLRWNSLSPEEQQAWAEYRQALLDVPQQEGFPLNVDWPNKPQLLAPKQAAPAED